MFPDFASQDFKLPHDRFLCCRKAAQMDKCTNHLDTCPHRNIALDYICKHDSAMLGKSMGRILYMLSAL